MKKLTKKITTAVAVLIALAIAGLLFVHFMPGWGLYFVRSGSMSPAINAGDIVITRPVGEIRPGMVVTFQQNDIVVTHRVLEIINGQLRTKGDANEDADPELRKISDAQGIYLFRIPWLGHLNSLVSNRRGWFIVIIVPTLILVGFIVWDIVKESMKKEAAKGGDATGGTEKQETGEKANTLESRGTRL